MQQTLKQLFNVGVQAVLGEPCVFDALVQSKICNPVSILSVGKAAASMLEGAMAALPNFENALMVTKYGHGSSQFADPRIEALEAAHPIPDGASLHAGQRVFDWVCSRPQESTLLFLLSGGASSLVELLKPEFTEKDLQALNRNALASGEDILTINQDRTAISAIKGGQLLPHFPGREVELLYISDVQGDALDTIGSGIGSCALNPRFDFHSRIVGSNQIARAAVEAEAKRLGLRVIENVENLYADVGDLALKLANRIETGPCGLYIWGGESTVRLPSNPGIGGRNQCLALRFAQAIADQSNVQGLFAGTDGTDGPTKYAGALVDCETFRSAPGGDSAIRQANSGAFLDAVGSTLHTGPTGTNVMDLGLVLKS
ncbi:DUF4147 domain-containing protein [Maritalea porphyrae]|uniref:DUF4147 domain-containing protein n=1 Tax=Maritalea porphyrae TaxID=880732 RepID=UPI0022AE9A22|nr:DUF4147 domain-containing protein [Maritalea porphyrae]MCZ4273408.1 DUF4147 domain-containing protein [Maritalea porphyrae]